MLDYRSVPGMFFFECLVYVEDFSRGKSETVALVCPPKQEHPPPHPNKK